jgi:dihydrofolate reductase
VSRIVVMLSVSLDGYIERADGSLDWHRVDDALHREFNDVMRPMAMFLNGRVMYELMAAYWPTADADPSASEPMRDFARIWRDVPKVVYSRTLESAPWNATVVHEVVPAEVAELKAAGDLALGGAQIATEFLRLGLVDELRLYVHPVVLGSGKPLFGDLRLDLRLLESRPVGNDVMLLRYAVVAGP